MGDYEKYEEDSKKIRKVNERLLNEFETWLKSFGLSEKTINNHVSNIDFYINEYLLYEDATEARNGADAVGMFLGYWFIRKAMWASKSSIKGNATSLKKFYIFTRCSTLSRDKVFKLYRLMALLPIEINTDGMSQEFSNQAIGQMPQISGPDPLNTEVLAELPDHRFDAAPHLVHTFYIPPITRIVHVFA